MRLLRARLGLFAALLLIAAPGCDSGAAPQAIGGTYRGSVAVDGFGTVTFRLVVPEVETGDSFRFTGTTQVQGESPESFSGSGQYDHPDLVLTDEDAPSDVIRGTVSADGDQFTLVDPDSQQSIILTR